ncbi:cholesterol 7-desaturase-like [Patiria miniata]|uniref:cholesterol 7-desaturase n=1 Tax=Patiria miniata TaxID=46514 RepID=A0A913ZJ16_PATMI|nr:cholesterol 7-desaturase-like [Patiria miniata]
MGQTAVAYSLLLYVVAPALVSIAICRGGLIPATSSSEDGSISWPAFYATYGLLAGLAYLTAAVLSFIYSPLEFYGDEGRDSYLIDKAQAGLSKEEAVAEMKRSRKIGDIPPVYPNGWFIVFRSAQVKKMETKYAHVLGLHVAVFRGESGQVYIVDAYCPHLGANLAIGGKVKGECIECPFHGWTYQGEDGKCVHIAYADKVPDFVKVKTYRSLEINGLILIWYHAEGEEPSWYPPEIEKIKTGELVYSGCWETYLDCHIQDIVENGGDVAHLDYVHGPQVLQKRFVNVKWEAHPTKKYLSTTYSETAMHWAFIPGNKIYHEQYGPGLSYVDANEFMLTGCVPVGPFRQKVVFMMYSAPASPFNLATRLFKKLKVYWSYLGIKGDVIVWANKTYRPKPILVKEDPSIAQHRRWFAQFYTENSPRLHPADSLQW